MPPAALSNDMLNCHAPKEIYEMQLIVLEIICVSVRLTSTICVTLEAKDRKEKVPAKDLKPKIPAKDPKRKIPAKDLKRKTPAKDPKQMQDIHQM